MGRRRVKAIISAESESLVTVTTCINGARMYVPPTLIFPRRNFSHLLVKGALLRSVFPCQPSGWSLHLQCQTHTKWASLLVLNGHNSHKKLCLHRQHKSQPHNHYLYSSIYHAETIACRQDIHTNSKAPLQGEGGDISLSKAVPASHTLQHSWAVFQGSNWRKMLYIASEQLRYIL